jgi:hypothetical protein
VCESERARESERERASEKERVIEKRASGEIEIDR